VARRTRSEQKDATRARLLKVARRAFAEQGYDQVGISAICRAARMTHGALYHHFAGKEELFAAVVAEVFQDLSQRILTAAKARDGWASVEAACAAYLDACADADVQAIVFRDGPRVLRSTFDAVDHAASAPLVMGLLGDWMAEGLLRPRPIAALARLLGAAFAEAGALVSEASDALHVRSQVDSMLAEWLQAFRRAPGETPLQWTTDRLTLKPAILADAVALLREKPESLVLASQERFARGALGLFVATDGQGTLIGAAGLVNDEGNELFAFVAPRLRRQGYGSEMAAAILREASARGIGTVQARADESDPASARLLERLGFVRWSQRGGTVDYVRAQPGPQRPTR
jgi:AcrR family transcriptional regulator